MTRYRSSSRHQRPAIFRRRMILQLTSLLDLLLIIVFVQYLEMQQVSAKAISTETERRQEIEAQRDRLLAGNQGNLYEVWEIHLNGNRSVYPDGSILISSATQKKVIEPRDAADFTRQIIDAMKFSPRPPGACIFLLTWGNVRRDGRDEAEARLLATANDSRLQSAWGEPAVKFRIVEGGYMEDTSR